MRYKILIFLIVVLSLVGCSKIDNCQNVQDLNYRDLCYLQKAINESDSNYCNKFSATASGSQMRPYCLLEIAKLTGDESLCKGNQQYVEECKNIIAVKNKNPDMCLGITHDNSDCFRKSTIAKAVDRLDPQLCEDAGDFNYDIADCLTKISMITKNESICNLMYDSFGGVRSQCLNQVAIEKKDIKLCNSEECFRELSTPETYDICSSMGWVGGTDCYINSICKMNNISYDCFSKIEALSSSTIERAIKINNASICEELGSLKPLCYSKFASKLGFSFFDTNRLKLYGQDAQSCEILKNKGIYEKKCIYNLAIISKNLSRCHELDGFYEDRCKLIVLLLKRNASQEEISQEINNHLPKIDLSLDSEGYLDLYYNPLMPVLIEFENAGNDELRGIKFNVFQGGILTNIDGCGEPINPLDICSLWILNDLKEASREITYDRKVIV